MGDDYDDRWPLVNCNQWCGEWKGGEQWLSTEHRMPTMDDVGDTGTKNADGYHR